MQDANDNDLAVEGPIVDGVSTLEFDPQSRSRLLSGRSGRGKSSKLSAAVSIVPIKRVADASELSSAT